MHPKGGRERLLGMVLAKKNVRSKLLEAELHPTANQINSMPVTYKQK